MSGGNNTQDCFASRDLSQAISAATPKSAAPKGSPRRREICRQAALARSAAMSPERRSEIGRNAANARWARGWMGKTPPGSAVMTYVPPVADRATPRGVERLVEVARAFTANPNDNETRLAFLKATFNLDRTAALIVALADEAKAGTAERSAEPREDISFALSNIEGG